MRFMKAFLFSLYEFLLQAEILPDWSKCMIFAVFVYRIGVNV